jgi:hypothetical protein
VALCRLPRRVTKGLKQDGRANNGFANELMVDDVSTRFMSGKAFTEGRLGVNCRPIAIVDVRMATVSSRVVGICLEGSGRESTGVREGGWSGSLSDGGGEKEWRVAWGVVCVYYYFPYFNRKLCLAKTNRGQPMHKVSWS